MNKNLFKEAQKSICSCNHNIASLNITLQQKRECQNSYMLPSTQHYFKIMTFMYRLWPKKKKKIQETKDSITKKSCRIFTDSVNKLLRSKILECIGNNHVPIVCKSKLSGLAPFAKCSGGRMRQQPAHQLPHCDFRSIKVINTIRFHLNCIFITEQVYVASECTKRTQLTLNS